MLRIAAGGAIYWHYPHYNVLLGVPHSFLRSGRYKLIEFFEGNRVELYDLHSDLGEQKNLATDLSDKTGALRKKTPHLEKTDRRVVARTNPENSPAETTGAWSP